MLGLKLRFQAIASQLKILAFDDSDFTAECLLSVAQEYMPHRVVGAQKKRLDLKDTYVLWDVLDIHGVVTLENQEGKSIRVGISFVESERKGSDLIYDLKGKLWYDIRQELKLEQYWVFLVKWKDFPQDKGEWIDILYGEIDIPIGDSGCRLIVL